MGLNPDQPASFGYKVAWLAMGTSDTERVARALRLQRSRAATWAEGVTAAYKSSIFVTPPLAGWTMAVSFSLCPPDKPEGFVKPLIEELSDLFGDAQYFCTHRVVEMHVWARALKGRLIRGYGWIGEKGLTLWDEGVQTKEERDLGFRFFDERSPDVELGDYWARKDLTFPDESCVMQLAGLWSIDPISLEDRFKEPGLGILGCLDRAKPAG